MSSTTEMTVVLQDSDIFNDSIMQRISDVRVLHRPLPENILDTQNLFILTSTTALPEVSAIVQAATQRHLLRALFVRLNVEPNFIPQMFERADLRSLQYVILHSNSDVPTRVLAAWQAGVQEQLIARAIVVNDNLLVTDCALKTWEIPFKLLPALAAIPLEKRVEFEIDEDGSYLYWPSEDIHLDMEALRTAVDPEWQEKLAADRAMYDQHFGAAIAAVRNVHNLKQTDIPGISSRQIRRIEKGSRPKLETLKKLSQAHGMKLNDYLEEVAQTISQLEKLNSPSS